MGALALCEIFGDEHVSLMNLGPGILVQGISVFIGQCMELRPSSPPSMHVEL